MKNAMGCLGLLAVLAEPALAPSIARACSPDCSRLSPIGTEEAPVHLPANGVFISPPYDSGPTRELTIVRTRAGASETRTVMFEYGNLQLADVEAGDRLVLSMTTSSCGAMSTVIDVTPAAPLPTRLGVLEVEASRRATIPVWDDRGGCTSDLVASVAPFTVTLDPSFEPWRDAMSWEQVTIDGAHATGGSDERIAHRYVYTPCEARLPSQSTGGTPDPGVGAHRLLVTAHLRGFTETFSTNEEMFALSCDGGPTCSATLTRRPTRAPWLFAMASLALVPLRTGVRRIRARAR